ncbi:MAG: branched-chain amino acid ABC transporter permease [Proteobacteria bacterium]|nr:branched-chain amino acid ABC transporter permease [Pseudomonadota bacterium]
MKRSTSVSSPSALAVVAGPHGIRRSAWLLLPVVAVFIAMPWWAGRELQRLCVEFMYTLALAQMWNLLVGYGGLVSIGQQAFVGIGAYTLVVLGAHWGIPAFLVIPVAGVVAMLLAVPMGALLFRLRGAYFAVGTWVAAEVLRLLVANNASVGAGSGTSVTAALRGMSSGTREVGMLWIALALGLGGTFGVYFWLRSRWGLALGAVRDSEPAAASLGVPVQRIKWWVWLAAAAGCGMVGALAYMAKLRVAPEAAFSLEWTTTAFFIVVLGGIGTIEGPIVGAVLFFALREVLADYGGVYLIVLGLAAIAVMLFKPRGLWGNSGWQLFPVRRLSGMAANSTMSADRNRN